jgi:hypothetical protein
MKRLFKMDQFQTSIATGCMEFSDMKRRVHVIGLAGMEQLQSNCALEVCFTTNKLTVAIGQR